MKTNYLSCKFSALRYVVALVLSSLMALFPSVLRADCDEDAEVDAFMQVQIWPLGGENPEGWWHYNYYKVQWFYLEEWQQDLSDWLLQAIYDAEHQGYGIAAHYMIDVDSFEGHSYEVHAIIDDWDDRIVGDGPVVDLVEYPYWDGVITDVYAIEIDDDCMCTGGVISARDLNTEHGVRATSGGTLKMVHKPGDTRSAKITASVFDCNRFPYGYPQWGSPYHIYNPSKSFTFSSNQDGDNSITADLTATISHGVNVQLIPEDRFSIEWESGKIKAKLDAIIDGLSANLGSSDGREESSQSSASLKFETKMVDCFGSPEVGRFYSGEGSVTYQLAEAKFKFPTPIVLGPISAVFKMTLTDVSIDVSASGAIDPSVEANVPIPLTITGTGSGSFEVTAAFQPTVLNGQDELCAAVEVSGRTSTSIEVSGPGEGWPANTSINGKVTWGQLDATIRVKIKVAGAFECSQTIASDKLCDSGEKTFGPWTFD